MYTKKERYDYCYFEITPAGLDQSEFVVGCCRISMFHADVNFCNANHSRHLEGLEINTHF